MPDLAVPDETPKVENVEEPKPEQAKPEQSKQEQSPTNAPDADEGNGNENGNVNGVDGEKVPQPEVEGASVEEPPEKKDTEENAAPDGDADPFGLDDLDVHTADLYNLANYTFGRKERESRSHLMRLSAPEYEAHLEKRHRSRGLRRAVAGVLLVHMHRLPHVLLLKRADDKGPHLLPGGRLRSGESDHDGLTRKLRAKLTPETPTADDDEQHKLEPGELLATWYAIDFGTTFYPYLPAHVSAAKEELRVYAVPLPEKFAFSVPRNMQLVAVPVYDIFENSSEYGNVIAAVPSLISKFHNNFC